MVFDEKGFVWLATQDGLNRYDGRHFLVLPKKFDDITSGSNSRLGKIVPAENHFLWMVTKGGQLEKLHLISNTFQTVPVLADKIKQSITSLLPEKDNKLWLGTESGKIILYDGNAAKIIREIDVPATTGQPAVTALFKDSRQRLWFAGSTIGYLKGNEVIKSVIVKPHTSKQAALFSSIAEDKEGNLWAGSWGRGLFIKKKTDSVFQSFFGYGATVLPPDLAVEALLADGAGNIWVGTYGKGLFLLSNKEQKIQQFVNDKQNPFSIAFNDVLSIKQDALGACIELIAL